MKNSFFRGFIFVAITFAFILIADASFAQCSMCKAVLESNMESGESSLGKGINDGIMYLMIFPYLLAIVVGYLLYKHMKKQDQASA